MAKKPVKTKHRSTVAQRVRRQIQRRISARRKLVLLDRKRQGQLRILNQNLKRRHPRLQR